MESFDVDENVKRSAPAGTGLFGNWTFEQGKTAKGRRFAIGLPDQFAVVEDCDGAPLAVPIEDLEKGKETRYVQSPQIIYSGSAGDFEADVLETYRSTILPEARVQLTRQALYANTMGFMGGGAVDDWLVEGKNCYVQVFEIKLPAYLAGMAPDVYEYYVKPLSYDHDDQLRITDAYGRVAPGWLKNLAFDIARTVELDEPVELDRAVQLARFCEEAVALDEFSEAVSVLGNVLVLSGSGRMSADLRKAIRLVGGDISKVVDDTPKIRAEAYNASLEEMSGYFGILVNALEMQKNLGNSEYAEMWSVVGDFGDTLMVDHMTIEGDEKAAEEANATGLIQIPPYYRQLRNNWQALAPEQ